MNNSFTYSYMISKLGFSLNDNSFDKVLSCPTNPVKRNYVKIKPVVTLMSDADFKNAMKIVNQIKNNR